MTGPVPSQITYNHEVCIPEEAFRRQCLLCTVQYTLGNGGSVIQPQAAGNDSPFEIYGDSTSQFRRREAIATMGLRLHQHHAECIVCSVRDGRGPRTRRHLRYDGRARINFLCYPALPIIEALLVEKQLQSEAFLSVVQEIEPDVFRLLYPNAHWVECAGSGAEDCRSRYL
jgi:hypothetical protein